MIIGGIDIIVPLPPGVPAAEIALGRVRRLWPAARFLDANEVESHAINAPRVLARGGRSGEFLVYKDLDALESWKREGLTPENANLMLNFIFYESEDGSPEMTLVCDSQTPEIEQLVDDLTASFEVATLAEVQDRAA